MSSNNASVYAYCMESEDSGFIVNNRQFLVDCFHGQNLVEAAKLPVLSDGQAFQVNVNDLLDLKIDAIRIVETSSLSQAARVTSAAFQGTLGLGLISNKDIGIVLPNFKSFINSLGRSSFFNHLLAEDFQNLDVSSSSSECLFLNLANLVCPTYCPLMKVKISNVQYYPMSPSFLRSLAFAVASVCPNSVKDGHYCLSIFEASSPSQYKGGNPSSTKHIRFSTIHVASAPQHEVTETPSVPAESSKSVPHKASSSLSNLSKPPLGRASGGRGVITSVASKLPKTSNASQMHQLQLRGPRGRASHTPSDYSEALTTPESSFDFTPSEGADTDLEPTVLTKRDASHAQIEQTNKIAPKVVARSSPAKMKTPASAIATLSSLKSPPTAVQGGPFSPKPASPPVPFHPNPSSIYEDENIMYLLFANNPFDIKFRAVFKYLTSYGWQERNVGSLWKHGPVFLRPHCLGAADFKLLQKDEDFFITEAAANSWLVRDFHTHAEENVQAFKARYNILPSFNMKEPALDNSAKKKRESVDRSNAEEDYFVATDNTPESTSSVGGTQSSSASIISPESEFEDSEIIKLLFSRANSKRSVFQPVFKYLRSYSWTYDYGRLDNWYYRPHCRQFLNVAGRVDRSKLVENEDYFLGDEAAESWIRKEIKRRHPDLVKAVEANDGIDKTRLKSMMTSTKLASKAKAKARHVASTTDSDEEYIMSSSVVNTATKSSIKAISTLTSSDTDASPLSQPADEFSDDVIIDALFGQPPSSKHLFQKAFKYLRSYNWYYEWGKFSNMYYRSHCRGRDVQTLIAGQDYFAGEDAAESWLRKEITKRNPSLVEAAKKGAFKNALTPPTAAFAVGKKTNQKKGNKKQAHPHKKPSVRKTELQTPDSSQASVSYNLSDEFHDSPSEVSVFSELDGFNNTPRQKVSHYRKRHAEAREHWNETLDSDASGSKEPMKKRKKQAADNQVVVPVPKATVLPVVQRIEIPLEHAAYTHLPLYDGNVDVFMGRMLHCIDDDAFHNHHLPFPVPGRKQESVGIFLNIMQSIRAGTGKLLYVAGFPGGGKTQSLVVIVKFIESLLKQYSQPLYLDYLVQNRKKTGEASSGYNSLSDTDASVKQRQYCDKYMHIVRVNCVSLVDVDHLYELVNNEMGIISKKVSNKREIKEVMDSILLNTKALPCTIPITNLESDAGYQLSPDYPDTSSRTKLELLPMLVLVLDEFDYVKTNKPAIYDSIMKWTTGRVLVLGSGNMMHAVMSTYVQSTTTLVFKAYDVPDLCSILQYRTGGLFSKPAQQMLALKVKERNNGDVRRLLGWAKAAMQLAWTMHKGANTADPASMEGFISIPHVAKTEPQSFEAEQRKSLSVLTPQLRTLLVSFIVSNGIRVGFTYKQAYAYLNEYLAKYNLGHESMDTVKSGISNLLDYAMIIRLNPSAKPDQALFRVNLREEELLNLDTNSLAEVQKNDIRRFMHQQKHLEDEEAAGF